MELRDAGDPVECAQAYDRAMADELVFLDITASHENRKTVLEMVEKVAETIYIPFTVGGGINSIRDIRDLLAAGCDKVSINTAAIYDETILSEASARFGCQCIVSAIDCRKQGPNTWEVYSHGGRKPCGRDTITWAKRVVELGAGEILLTSMDRDGTRQGYDLELLRAVTQAVNVPVIASGGVGTLQHLADGILTGGADAVLAASIFHFGEFKIHETKEYLAQQGIPVRMS